MHHGSKISRIIYARLLRPNHAHTQNFPTSATQYTVTAMIPNVHLRPINDNSTLYCRSRKNLESESGGHQWREYTYRKITPCDACGQVLRGHARQGFRCRNCKTNAHADCMSSVQPVNCPSLLPKRTAGIPLLRRQKSQAQPVEEAPVSEPSESPNTVSLRYLAPFFFFRKDAVR